MEKLTGGDDVEDGEEADEDDDDVKTVRCFYLSLVVLERLWSFNTLQSHHPLRGLSSINPISLNGNLYWDGVNRDYREVVVSIDFYAAGTESNRCQVTLFPDAEIIPKFKRMCTSFQGFIMYMNIVPDYKHVEYTLRAWNGN
ncbi:unnamed protein product [Arabidopsis halleri]